MHRSPPLEDKQQLNLLATGIFLNHNEIEQECSKCRKSMSYYCTIAICMNNKRTPTISIVLNMIPTPTRRSGRFNSHRGHSGAHSLAR